MKHLLVFLLLLCSASVSAQDVIVKKDGSTILSKVLEVGQEEIKYKKHDNLEGPTYIIQKSELQAINYQNGAKIHSLLLSVMRIGTYRTIRMTEHSSIMTGRCLGWTMQQVIHTKK